MTADVIKYIKCPLNILAKNYRINGLAQNCSISSANALEIPQSYAKANDLKQLVDNSLVRSVPQTQNARPIHTKEYINVFFCSISLISSFTEHSPVLLKWSDTVTASVRDTVTSLSTNSSPAFMCLYWSIMPQNLIIATDTMHPNHADEITKFYKSWQNNIIFCW